MSLNEIKTAVEEAIAQHVFFQWWHYLLWILVTGAGAYFGTYLREKGKNIATKEDIGKITEEIEKVRTSYAKQIEEIREKQQLRLAALDKRLEAHQKAYTLWDMLVRNVRDHDKIGAVVIECQKWWYENCLYLAPKARKAFRHATFCAFHHKDYIAARDVKIIKENWKDIIDAGDEIVRGAELPPLGEDEIKYFEKKDTNKTVLLTPSSFTSE